MHCPCVKELLFTLDPGASILEEGGRLGKSSWRKVDLCQKHRNNGIELIDFPAAERTDHLIDGKYKYNSPYIWFLKGFIKFIHFCSTLAIPSLILIIFSVIFVNSFWVKFLLVSYYLNFVFFCLFF